MESLDRTYQDLERVYSEYTHVLNQSVFWDSIEALYNIWDAQWKSHWGKFSMAYSEGSEFYRPDLPLEPFWSLILVMTVVWNEEEMKNLVPMVD